MLVKTTESQIFKLNNMKTRKSHSIILAFFLMAFVQLNAQIEKGVAEEQKQEVIEQFKANAARLALTPAQKEPFQSITKKYAEKLKLVRASDESKINKMKTVKALQSDKNAEMKGLLTETQFKTYLQIQDENIKKMKEKRKG